MANLTDSSIWESGIYQIETSDPVVGGAGGVSNLQSQQLANRTKKLHDELEKNSIWISTAHSYRGQNLFIVPGEFEGTVADGDIVYRNTVSDQFEKAISDGTNKSVIAGIADVTNGKVITNGLFGIAISGASYGDTLFLSSTTAGEITLTSSDVPIGTFLYDDIIFVCSTLPLVGNTSLSQINAADSNGLKLLEDSGTNGITIDDNGIVTKNVQPSFRGYVLSDQSLTGGVEDELDIGGTSYNIGGHGSQASNNFIAPVSGLYLITAQAEFDVNTSGDRLSLRIDVEGTDVSIATVSASGTVSQTVSTTTMEMLSAGDEVTVGVSNLDNNDSINSGENQSFFCITLLS